MLSQVNSGSKPECSYIIDFHVLDSDFGQFIAEKMATLGSVRTHT